ncbi:MAG: nucleotidyl transferase AbiEii/AbiGii toxin family protein [Gammaproteobacteria bacterium]|nr:nucleotidyl transferase AbiEii/AbiGii toxin family protein [Gammaproteobacteria bacterium]MDE0479611.1 nucleotidyl transferase AbiEii/AbiGii toxin family protein [Gammaproteobacteria bacterium]MDE0508886.1 nucleotidyl transferase AbiEii/AbiGii toxin family protein [Gammaproteobacteria bacterium]
MSESFFTLSQKDQREALEYVRAESGRPAHLLEKDIWVVWVLRTLFEASIGDDITFKGGTSLSKVYGIIDRFSEDIDLTYDIRKLIPDLVGDGGELPSSRSRAGKWTKVVRSRLPGWITKHIQPLIYNAMAKEQLKSRVELGGHGNDKLLLHYPALTRGTGYIAPVVTLEFGGRATGEPRQIHEVVCDAAEHLSDVYFPTASPQVMSVARTFWEKATAAHVFCAQGRLRGIRFARHWHDLAAIGRSEHFATAVADREVAVAVASHKGRFFVEKDRGGQAIDYSMATSGHLKIVPEGRAKAALSEDYEAMLADDVMIGEALTFEELMDACAELEEQVNRAGN